ncbi:tumor necrosis factor receptor superfamily member 5 [Ictalurus punctatus]|uniref:Tumor necrosis factor receptor superfamily member 5 n=1 Tax=Ictalurus punctatus TaxID=7998 RepID=A0A2D0RQE1_ICTPU|nr:tumor necrosis factor receptor superfamily member 5 [Ictalurus punctatus]
MRKLLTTTCSPDQHEHNGVCCKRCPKGTHMSAHCNESSETQCKRCAQGFFTENQNYIDNCLACTSCDPHHHLQTSKDCTEISNRKCGCVEGFYCTQPSGNVEDHCEKCEAVHRCPPGHGVSARPNSTHDTVCEPCPPGTFNNETDYVTPCRTHTGCLDLGRSVLSEGTTERDAKCGDFVSRCHWMIPASLWAGLIVTLILIFIGVVCVKSKRRRKAVITAVNFQNFVPPALPPDVIEYPGSQELESLTVNKKPCAVEVDGVLECDGVSVNMLSEKCAAFSMPDTCMTFFSEPFESGPFRSEPQEDDWPGL